MTQLSTPAFSDSDLNILKVLMQRYSLSTLVAALSRICFWQAEQAASQQQNRETIREWREDASILNKTVVQLNH
ncbi:hypothetical protein [Leptolyngbya sp. FACHB-261]|uniref:hypothetical protein n=1 Tax=Leptolyngbya sp. FACHB-261 TaxID=2692806 RepID=UPI0016859C11|nr:hypothetical protein [Leptolyngbya sp. FACHB-261]MBD2099434.1 hypothetical protein [Leptolyngbya sp. FACHB-261]